MSDDGKGKAVGGAAVGAGGVLAMLMKLCAHEPGVAATAARGAGEVGIVARGAGEVGAIGAAGRGAGEIGALKAAGQGAGEMGALEVASQAGEMGVLGHGAAVLASGERGAGQLVLSGLGAPVEVSNLSPVVAHAAEDGARAGASARGFGLVGTVSGKGTAARSSKLKEALSHAADAKDALDLVLDAWDIYKESLDDDVQAELDRKLSPNGLSSSDVLPALRGEPLDGLAGATRTLLSDGHALVAGARLADDARSSKLEPNDKRTIAKQQQSAPIATIYLEIPSDDRVTKAATLSARLFMADISTTIEWVELATTGPVKLPAILEQGRHRFVRIAAGGARVVVLRSIATSSDGGTFAKP